MKGSFLRNLINRYQHGKASRAERYIVERWYDSFDLGTPDVEWLKDQHARKQFEDRILAHMLNRTGQRDRYQHSWWLVAAAIFLVSIFSMLFYPRQEKLPVGENSGLASKEVRTGAVQLKKVSLPDSTEVFLNANSSLTIPPSFAKQDRHILLSGEAFFNVRKDSRFPFIVKTAGLDIRVLGTSFNVRSYEALQDIRVTVNTGSVGVYGSGRVMAALNAKEQLNFYKNTGKYERVAVAQTDNPAWLSGTVLLDRAPFEELAQTFNNMYGQQLVSKDPEVLKGVYNMTIRRDRNIRQTMEQLCTLIGRKYRKEGTQQIIIY